MARQQIQIQEAFLFTALKEHRPVTVALLSGEMLKGRIKRFDNFTIVVETQENERFIYKSAIAAIAVKQTSTPSSYRSASPKGAADTPASGAPASDASPADESPADDAASDDAASDDAAADDAAADESKSD
jgi:host factor-I protein